ncbi:hypothetical protein BGX24_007128 [Mortierella sp. AD032]|nr:hypothetical protein BGX24_007128 [Mortierella sp. AD032]
MLDAIPGVNTGYNSTSDGPTTDLILDSGWMRMTPALLEYKVVQSIGYILSSSAATNMEPLMTKSVTHVFITETIQEYVFADIAVELLMIVLVIVFYIAWVSGYTQCHGDDLDNLPELLASKDDEPELDPLKEY